EPRVVVDADLVARAVRVPRDLAQAQVDPGVRASLLGVVRAPPPAAVEAVHDQDCRPFRHPTDPSYESGTFHPAEARMRSATRRSRSSRRARASGPCPTTPSTSSRGCPPTTCNSPRPSLENARTTPSPFFRAQSAPTNRNRGLLQSRSTGRGSQFRPKPTTWT